MREASSDPPPALTDEILLYKALLPSKVGSHFRTEVFVLLSPVVIALVSQTTEENIDQ